MRADQVLAIIPAYNEASRINAVILALKDHGYAVLVVDDGSRDDTARVAADSGAVVVRQANGGKGAAMRLGCAWAARAGYRRVLLLDGDGQHDPAEAGRLLAAAQRSGAEVVIGKRTLLPARQPLYRRCFNRLSSLLVTLAAGHGIRDSQSGYRLLDPVLLLRLPLQGRRYDLESEFCILACRAGVRLVEVPITVIYLDKRSGVHPLWDTLRFFYAVGMAVVHVRSRLRRFRPERWPQVRPLPVALPTRIATGASTLDSATSGRRETSRTAFG
jgi:glycosyltransferase involved in cell wall biosynthesis